MNQEEPEPRVTYRRFHNHQYAAMAVAAIALVVSAVDRGAKGLVQMAAAMIFILSCILFPEAIGSIKGPGYTTETSHPGALALIAWIVLAFVTASGIARLF